jgi:hypothetical protein
MKEITIILKYAYVKDIILLPNITTPDGYKSRLTISYDIKDINGNFVEVAHKEHFSDATKAMLSYTDYKAWQAANEANFIAADKLDLVNFTGE